MTDKRSESDISSPKVSEIRATQTEVIKHVPIVKVISIDSEINKNKQASLLSKEDLPVQTAIDKINNKSIRSVGDVTELKRELHIATFTPEQTISLYIDVILQDSNNYLGQSIANIWDLLAVELMLLTSELSIVSNLSKIHFRTAEKNVLHKIRNSNLKLFGQSSNCFKILSSIIDFKDKPVLNDDYSNFNEINTRIAIMWNRESIRNKPLDIISEPKYINLISNKYYVGSINKDATPNFNANNEELEKLVWEELRNEGSCASVNVKDSDGGVFTWGRGFSITTLTPIISNLYQDNVIKIIFNLYGIKIIDNKINVLNNHGNTLTNDEAWNFMHAEKSIW